MSYHLAPPWLFGKSYKSQVVFSIDLCVFFRLSRDDHPTAAVCGGVSTAEFSAAPMDRFSRELRSLVPVRELALSSRRENRFYIALHPVLADGCRENRAQSV